MKKHILISDPSLRDGNHAVRHNLTTKQIAAYCDAADLAGIPIIEVGHGNGLGASSLQLGLSVTADEDMITVARKHIKKSKLGIFMIPGFATIKRDLQPAIEKGIDVVRVGSHCTEADTTKNHIEFARNQGKEVYGNLMMSHMASPDTLLTEVLKMQSYGAMGVVLMDSAGALLPEEVTARIKTLVEGSKISIGFHAHNNLGMAIANSIAAVSAGATILDGCSRGFGAGAGNAQLEVLVAVLEKMGYQTGIDLYKVLDLSDLAEKTLMKEVPAVRPISIVGGLAGVVSTFNKHVERIAEQYSIDAKDLFFELGKRKVVAGQEDIIIEVARTLAMDH
jgi:4-hydroxy 2-oxovalerate aldolase